MPRKAACAAASYRRPLEFPLSRGIRQPPRSPLQGRIIPNHPDLPAHLQNLEPKAPDQALRVLRRVQRANKQERQAKALAAPLPPKPPPVLQKHEDFYPDYPED